MKKKSKIAFLSSIFLLAGIYFLIRYTAYLDTCTSYYPIMNSAVSDGAVYRGWLFQKIPVSSTNIYEQHDIETNRIFIRFDIKESEWPNIVKDLRQLSALEIEKIDVRYPFNVDWWFECLIEQCPSNDNGLHAEIYSGILDKRHGHAFLLKDKYSQSVYYWNIDQ